MLLFSSLAVAQPQSGNEAISVTDLTMGFSGRGRVGNWLPLRLSASGLPSDDFSLLLMASDPRGDQCESVVCAGRPDEQGVLSLEGVFMTGRIDGIIRLRLEDSSGKTVWQHVVKCHDSEGVQTSDPASLSPKLDRVISEMSLFRHHALSVLTVGAPTGLAELSVRLASTGTREVLKVLPVAAAADFPTTRRGLDSVDTILLVSDFGLTETQTRAIQDWTITGGNFIVSCGENLPQLLQSPVGSWLQAPFGIQNELIRSQDLTAMQNYVAGASQLQTNRQNVPIVRLAGEQPKVIIASINGPLLMRLSSGAGVVTMVAVDVNEKPLNRWLSLSQFYEMLLFDRMLDSAGEQSNRRGRISSSGVTDLATQLANVSDAIPATERWSSWHAMLLMLVYLVIIGPLDYLFVVRFLHRPGLTWFTFPALVATACGLTLWWSSEQRAAATVREVHLLDVAQADSRHTVHARSWSSLSTSDTRYGSVNTVQPPELFGPLATPDRAMDQSFIWHGRAEDVYGGLYREGGAVLGQQTSYRTEIGDGGFTSIPMMVDGSQAFLAESFRDVSDSPLFESSLTMPPTGLLDGSFTHHLPASIRDWVIVFGNRVYVPSQKSEEKSRQIKPNEPWTRDSGGVRVAEIRDFLRGVRIIARERKMGDKDAGTTPQIQAIYNTSGKNPLDILLMVSFYNAAGGDIYVRLQDDYLKRAQVSDSVQLSTAVLIGVMDLPLSELQLDGEPVLPAETQTVVRLFLPVSRSVFGESIQEADPKEDSP